MMATMVGWAEMVADFLVSPPVLPTVSAACFGTVFAAKYTKTIIGCYTYITFEARPIAKKPKYTSADTSVIIPTTFDDPKELLECITRIKRCDPAQIYVVCQDSHVKELRKIVKGRGWVEDITVIGVEKLNKRVQILAALDYVTTDIIVLADDDVFWPSPIYLDLLLAIFEDDRVGAGGTRQRVRRDVKPNVWNFWGIGYLERRTWNNATTNAIDGSLSTLSGRTAAYRAEILQTKDFAWYFANDSWRGLPLNSDDDKCLTRYVYSNGWRIAIQFDARAVLETTVENGPKYIKQCLRWARAHWRGNCTVMENESYWRFSTMPWGTYVIYWGSYLTPTIFWELLMFAFLYGAVGGTSSAVRYYAAFGTWVLMSKLVKYTPHFWRYPQDMRFIPAALMFSYLHGFLNVYCYFTMTNTHWGSKDGIEEVSTARQLLESGWESKYPVKNADVGHADRFSEGGPDHFRTTIPGSHVMTKEDIVRFHEMKRREAQDALDNECAITDSSPTSSDTGMDYRGNDYPDDGTNGRVETADNTADQTNGNTSDQTGEEFASYNVVIVEDAANDAVTEEGLNNNTPEGSDHDGESVPPFRLPNPKCDDPSKYDSNGSLLVPVVKSTGASTSGSLLVPKAGSTNASTTSSDGHASGSVGGMLYRSASRRDTDADAGVHVTDFAKRTGSDDSTANGSDEEEVDYSETKQRCTEGCPELGRIYDTLPRLKRC